MPLQGLSLLGFMNEQLAIHYLTNVCICPDTSQDVLLQHWREAQARVGPPVERAGHPEIRDLPAEIEQRLREMLQHPRHQPRIGSLMISGISFKSVELAPLLAFQFHVATDHSSRRCGTEGSADQSVQSEKPGPPATPRTPEASSYPAP